MGVRSCAVAKERAAIVARSAQLLRFADLGMIMDESFLVLLHRHHQESIGKLPAELGFVWRVGKVVSDLRKDRCRDIAEMIESVGCREGDQWLRVTQRFDEVVKILFCLAQGAERLRRKNPISGYGIVSQPAERGKGWPSVRALGAMMPSRAQWRTAGSS